MSKCGRTHLLDAMTAGEVAPALAVDLRAHASACARCRHELNWLESEQRLFRHRAGRDEVQHLWQGIEQRTPRLRTFGRNRMLVALAAGLLLMLGVGRLAVSQPHTTVTTAGSDDAQALQSLEWGSEPMSFEDPQACSKLTPGLGFHCGTVQSSVLASR